MSLGCRDLIPFCQPQQWGLTELRKVVVVVVVTCAAAVVVVFNLAC